MTTKHEGRGVFATIGRAADQSLDIAAAIRDGRLTRSEFDAWYSQRRAEGTGIVITLRETAAELARPVEKALEKSVKILGAAAPRAAKRHTRRKSRHAPHPARKVSAK